MKNLNINYRIGAQRSVIAQTKAMKSTPQLHGLDCYGLIDRDYRSEKELNAYKANNIFSINVAEVENLFLVEELLKIVNSKIAAKQDETSIEEIKKYVIEDRFSNEVHKQILESTVYELKYQLSIVEFSKDDENTAKQKFADFQKEIDFDIIKSEQEKSSML